MTTPIPHDPRPAWSFDPFYRFLDYLGTERQLLNLASSGIEGLVRQERLAKALHDVSHLIGTEKAEARAQLRRARETAKLAQREVDADFPLLHAHSLIGVWGALEALVHDVLRTWIKHRPSLLKEEAFGGMKITLGEYQRLKGADRIDYLLDQVRPQGSGGGFQRLEAWLSKIGLDGPLDEQVRRSLIESWEVRNVYAHRRGICDGKARRNCPWRKRDWKLGQPILVSHVEYVRYLDAAHAYAYELIVRAGAQFGLDVHAHAKQITQLVASGEFEFDETGRTLDRKRKRVRKKAASANEPKQRAAADKGAETAPIRAPGRRAEARQGTADPEAKRRG